jgi:hypothetical protein
VRKVEAATESINQQFAIQTNFPPCSGHKVADKCQQMRMMRDTAGNIPEPHWYAGIQLLCHSIEGDPLIHEWSKGYAGYSEQETDTKIAQVRSQNLGPSLCSTFASRNPGGCDGCPVEGKISSPAQLGRPEIQRNMEPPTSKPALLPVTIPVDPQAPSSETPAAQVPAAQTPPLLLLGELNKEYAWVRKQKQIYRFRHADFIKLEELRNALANWPTVQAGDSPKPVSAVNAWLRSPDRREYDDVVYEPGQPAIYQNKINLWKGWGWEPIAGDIKPWSDLLDEAFGVGTIERTYVEQWFAYQIQNPGAKLYTAVVLWSPIQGIGKTLIGVTFAMLFGENASVISSDVIRSSFNDWSKRKQFILGEETTSQDARGSMDSLKHLITGDTIIINEKYQPRITLRNTINFMFTSNHPNAVQIDMNDRRFFVVEFVGDKLSLEFFAAFVNWRDERGGLSALMHHLLHVPLDGFNPTAAPPATGAKEQMMEASLSDLERWIHDRYTDLAAPILSEVVYAGDLANQYYGQKGQYATETAIGRALTRVGRCARKRVDFPPGGRKQLCAIRRHQYWSSAPEKVWAEEYEKGCTMRANGAAAAAKLTLATAPRSRHGLH